MKVLVCGDRNWTDKNLIRTHIENLTGLELVIEGEARGADIIAREVAEELGIPVQKFPANWHIHGRAGGMIRNSQMLDEKPDLVLAFHDNLAGSKGTKDTVQKAKQRGIPVQVIAHQSPEYKSIKGGNHGLQQRR